MGELSVMVGVWAANKGASAKIKACFPEGTEMTPGDTKLIWDSSKTVEVEAARATFDKLKAAGYLAYRAEGKDGHQGAAIREFDPNAERIIMIPKVMGGGR